jgi:hypothetical protein
MPQTTGSQQRLDDRFVELFNAARHAPSNADRDVFLDTLRACEAEGAQLDSVYLILESACNNVITAKFYTRVVYPAAARLRKLIRQRRKTAEAALRRMIEIHDGMKHPAAEQQAERHNLPPLDDAAPYRRALEYLTETPVREADDILVRWASTAAKRGSRAHDWVPEIYKALKKARVQKKHHAELLRLLGLIP